MVTLDKPTISNLSVSARIRVMDPFRQIKRDYNTILADADSANRINWSHLRVLHDALSPGNVSQSDQYLKVNC